MIITVLDYVFGLLIDDNSTALFVKSDKGYYVFVGEYENVEFEENYKFLKENSNKIIDFIVPDEQDIIVEFIKKIGLKINSKIDLALCSVDWYIIDQEIFEREKFAYQEWYREENKDECLFDEELLSAQA
jgi:hypothetical protein